VVGIVVDLRNNGGGSLLEATTLTGLFIDQGPVVQVRNSSGRVSTEEDTEPGMAWAGPLAVLVNRYSASASEIFAAAIQDYGRGLVIGEPTFGKGTVQSLLDLQEWALNDSAQSGQLKITQAQFFRVNGGSTQNRGVLPDIRMPSAGDPQKYGERSLDNALPWTEIDSAQYDRSGDLKQLAAVTDSRFRNRIVHDREFNWLQDDITEFNANEESHKVSLLESARRLEMDEAEAKRKARRELQGGDPVLSADEDLLAVGSDGSAEALDEALGEDGEEDDEEPGPDLLLRESARIVADMVELAGDGNARAQPFALLQAIPESDSVN
jgi:carboxyl-terminal processing protease